MHDSTIPRFFVSSHFLVSTTIQDAPTVGCIRSAAAHTPSLQCCRNVCVSQERTQPGSDWLQVWVQVYSPDSLPECLPFSCCSRKTAIHNSSLRLSAIRIEQVNWSTDICSCKEEFVPRGHRQKGGILVAGQCGQCVWYRHLWWSYQTDRIWVCIQSCSCSTPLPLTECGAV